MDFASGRFNKRFNSAKVEKTGLQRTNWLAVYATFDTIASRQGVSLYVPTEAKSRVNPPLCDFPHHKQNPHSFDQLNVFNPKHAFENQLLKFIVSILLSKKSLSPYRITKVRGFVLLVTEKQGDTTRMQGELYYKLYILIPRHTRIRKPCGQNSGTHSTEMLVSPLP
ncbi:hypothetical protein NX059_003224 [Plenodomus lindquistii]|nr:hypothetical protein NX059_003224 [Plenodomus lindquistii]